VARVPKLKRWEVTMWAEVRHVARVEVYATSEREARREAEELRKDADLEDCGIEPYWFQTRVEEMVDEGGMK